MATQEKKCGLCVHAGTVRERYTLGECLLLILTLPATLFFGGLSVRALLHGISVDLVGAVLFCILFVISYFLLWRLGRAIVGTYLYHFQDADEAMHCHKHNYGNGEEDEWRRTQGAQDNTYLREAVGGWRKKSSMFRNGEEVKSFRVKSPSRWGVFDVNRLSIQLMYLQPGQVLLAENLVPSTSDLLLFQLLERQRCVDEANGARRQNDLLNEALDAQALGLASAIDFALGQKRGARESRAVAGIRAKLESILEELLEARLGTLRERIVTAPEGEWAASREHLLRLIDARLNRHAETVDEPVQPLLPAVAEQPTVP